MNNWVCASLPSVMTHFDNAMKDNPEHLTSKTINNFFINNMNKFLSSIGVCMVKGKPYDSKLIDKYYRIHFKRIQEREYLKDCEIIIDSAGFQIQTGYLPPCDISKFINMYHHEFLEKYHSEIDWAFTLDIAPGSVHSPVSSFSEMYNLNVESYRKSAELEESARKKMLYIHHFRTPKIRKIYKKMLFEDKLADPFCNFATGGLVSFSGGGTFPIIMYAVPLMDIIYYAKQRGLKKFRFHVLGASDYKEILGHMFLQRHIKHIHDIDVEITYDSSTAWKCLAMGRYTYILDEEDRTIWKITARSDSLHQMWRNKGTIEDIYYKELNRVSVPYGMKKLTKDEVPLYKDGSMARVTYAYGLFQIFDTFRRAQEWCEDIVDNLYPLYLSGEIVQFDNQIEKWMMRFNNGKKSKKLQNRTISIYNTLKAIETIDLDFADHLVNKYMTQDECKQLMGMQECTF